MPFEAGHSCAKCHKSGILIADGKRERLTRCLGNNFLVRAVREGITTNDEGDQVVAEFLTDSRVRNRDFRCGSADDEFYFHQSCLQRQDAAALSFDSQLTAKRKDKEGRPLMHLNNFTHQLCSGCLVHAADELGEDLPSELNGPKGQALCGASHRPSLEPHQPPGILSTWNVLWQRQHGL